MLPHAGTGTRIWKEVLELGADLGKLSAVKGSTVHARAAILWDVESFWAQDLEWRPSSDLDHRERIEAYYSVLWNQGISVDFAHPEADFSGYDLVLAPALYLVGDAAAANLRGYVDGGGHLLVSYFSGIVDSNDTVPHGASPGALRDILGLEIHEFLPLRAGETVTLSGGGTGTAWSEEIHPGTATVLETYISGPATTLPALTRNEFGSGTAWYVSTKLDGDDLTAVVLDAARAAGLEPASGKAEGLEVVIRSTGTDAFTFLINHADADAEYPATGIELITADAVTGTAQIPAGTVRVIHTHHGNA
ncbi:beta-galactosidase trimerization domain-containing protein [Arthrobacter sp. UYCu712]|uniref:beta-galactosidase n=1 Tax=Arthrobacter sp. UYCu712 TaxID=3156340 RepID=UPI0033968F8B